MAGSTRLPALHSVPTKAQPGLHEAQWLSTLAEHVRGFPEKMVIQAAKLYYVTDVADMVGLGLSSWDN